jgi:calcineurin-like phosphoesterase family protein
MRWFTSDWHLWHDNILKFTTRHFRSSYRMNVSIRDRYIESGVNDEDDVYVLGDVMMKGADAAGSLENFLATLPGRKHLILGNHDRLTPWQYHEVGFASVHTWLDLDPYVLVHDPAMACCWPGRNILCGHVHELFWKSGRVLNVGLDVWDLHPVMERDVQEVFSSPGNTPI